MIIGVPVYVVQRISDIVPNPFIGREIIGKLLDRLHVRGFDHEMIGKVTDLIVEQLRKSLHAERNRLAEILFKKFVKQGQIQFRLRGFVLTGTTGECHNTWILIYLPMVINLPIKMVDL